MIKILIIEDEIPARKKLRRFIETIESPIEIVAELDTKQSAIEFLKHSQPDLIFSDIELLDGNAFEIYSQITIICPIIFTTAYDRFWMDAFKSNGIDYLLKPFSKDRFLKAWDKFLLLGNSSAENQNAINELTKLFHQNFIEKSYKKRFAINTIQGIYFLDSKNILFFKADEGVIFAFDLQGKKHILTESSLKEIQAQLDPFQFFRINRSEIVNKAYVQNIQHFKKNVLAIKLIGFESYLKTSQSQTSKFREWVTN